ncbi:MAG: protein CheD [Clostridia bacterium]|jgi:chemotaxis protein CheD|nr:protein CheD [Clostridia bacterium]
MGKLIIVGISDQKIAASPDILITYALGSCVGICLYDTVMHVGGLSHILLPTASIQLEDKNIFKFADTAIEELLKTMEKYSCSRYRITAKIIGGANMFATSGISIGDRNVEAVKSELSRLKIRIVAEDTGSNYGRTVELNPENGIVTVKSMIKGNKTL